jgi:hypothetical protein
MWYAAFVQEVSALVSAEDRARLEAIAADHKPRAKACGAASNHAPVRRAAERRRDGAPRQDRPAGVWRWQRRVATTDVDGLLRDATRKLHGIPNDGDHHI